MSDLKLSSMSEMPLSIPKLRDNGNNWPDYEPRLQKAMGAKGLWRHVEGTATAPQPYTVVNNVTYLHDLTTVATEDQIEMKEMRIMDFDKKEYLAQHIILSTTSMRLGAKIKNLKSAKEMWEESKLMLRQRAHSTLLMPRTSWQA